ncbi:MAG: sigma-70 family RNA polymerase sigma factor [Bacteroidia bacterium]|nr:sigma-70 family RNA polymerase sigma factor [Bacteroidia bacterium]
MENQQLISLVQGCLAHNGSATVALWDEVLRIGRNVFANSGFDAEEVKDFVHEKAEKLIFPCVLPSEGNVRAYIVQVFKNLKMEKWRTRSRNNVVSLDTLAYTDETGAESTVLELIMNPSKEPTDSWLRTTELRQALEACFSKMGSLQAAVLRLSIIEALRNTEIAEMLGVSKTSVETAKFHGRERLITLLKRNYNIRESD